MKAKSVYLFILFWVSSGIMMAQDLHWSQYYHSPINLNPALAGVFKGDYRGVANFRQQWQQVPVPYTTFSVGGDGQLPVPTIKNTRIAAALQINLDQAGDLQVQSAEVLLGAACQYFPHPEFGISLGGTYGITNQRLDASAMRTAAQFDGELYRPTLPTAELTNLEPFNFTRFNAGLNFTYQSARKRTRIQQGAGFFNLNKPNVSLLSNSIDVGLRTALYAMAWVEIHPLLDVRAHFYFHTQGFASQSFYQEIVSGTGIRYHLDTRKGRETSLAFVPSIRFGDAFIPSLEIQYHQWQAALSYDVNISAFQVATRRRGGIELSLLYLIKLPEPPPVFKACPVY